MHVIPREHDGHEGHDDHTDEERDTDDHDDHSDEERDRDDHDEHSDDEDGHDDHDDHDDHEDEDLGRFDPHSWLDPLSYRAQAALVRDSLIETFPEHESTFTANADAYMAELLTLHEEFSETLSSSTCENKQIASNHNAYAYLAERYDLEFTTVHGLDPEGEPTLEEVMEVVEKIEEDEITVFYVEEYTNEESVDSLVEQTKSDTLPDGVSLKILHTMELPPKDANDGYVDRMKENLDNLVAGIC